MNSAPFHPNPDRSVMVIKHIAQVLPRIGSAFGVMAFLCVAGGGCSDVGSYGPGAALPECGDCHGVPPVAPGEAAGVAGAERVENYPSGGGAHKIHVDFLLARFREANATPSADDLCSPCHGAGAGRAATHNSSGRNKNAAWAWDASARSRVLLADGRGHFAASGSYNGQTLGTGVIAGGEPQECAQVDCHGPGVPYNVAATDTAPYSNGYDRLSAGFPSRPRLLWDYTRAEYADDGDASSVYDPLGRSFVCGGCHGYDPVHPGDAPDIKLQKDGGTTVYDSKAGGGPAKGVAANYFGTVSGFSRGGHGDAGIEQEDPFRDSGAGTTPLTCEACHDNSAPHFPPAAQNLHRLVNTVLEDETHSAAGLCNSCHSAAIYPGPAVKGALIHHPSFWGSYPGEAEPIEPAPGQEIMTDVDESTSWVELYEWRYSQSAYGAANASGDVDYFVDFWGGKPGDTTQPPPPRPVPFVVLPVARYVGNQGETDRVMCVTCHNPHGTDLIFFTTGAVDLTRVPDNDMLRVRYHNDNALCNACH
ncbi:hypothetical protein EPN96_05260 [bacterium]|nr:MAG: hypothetical protein EPN96_05260 [bacterium]